MNSSVTLISNELAFHKAVSVCYRYESKKSDQELIDMMLYKGHLRPLEFIPVYLCLTDESTHEYSVFNEFLYVRTPWCYVYKDWDTDYLYVSTHLRQLCELNLYSLFSSSKSEPFHSLHIPRHTFYFTLPRSIADEFRTHTGISSLMESTRYVNYEKKEYFFCRPFWVKDTSTELFYNAACDQAMFNYSQALSLGLKPEAARDLLPLSIGTHLIQQSFLPSWKNFVEQRTGSGAHPDARVLANQVKSLLDLK